MSVPVAPGTRIGHVHLKVADLDRAIAFYGGVLGFELQQKYGLDCIRVSKTHCKVVTIATDDGWRIVARGSLNLNANPRMEQIDVSDDQAIYDVMHGLEEELWRRGKPLAVEVLEHRDAAELFGGGWQGVGMGEAPDWAKPDMGDGGGWF